MEQIDYNSISCCFKSLEMLADVGTGWTEMRNNSWLRINYELLDGVMDYVGNT